MPMFMFIGCIIGAIPRFMFGVIGMPPIGDEKLR